MPTEALTDTSDLDDSSYGPVMFWIFLSAVVLISILVALIALVDTWWVLGFVFAGHLVATAVVSVVIARALAGRTAPALLH